MYRPDLNIKTLNELEYYGYIRMIRRSQCSGYHRKRDGIVIENYKGRYGTGYKVHYPSDGSTRYHIVEYYVYNETQKENENEKK